MTIYSRANWPHCCRAVPSGEQGGQQIRGHPPPPPPLEPAPCLEQRVPVPRGFSFAFIPFPKQVLRPDTHIFVYTEGSFTPIWFKVIFHALQLSRIGMQVINITFRTCHFMRPEKGENQ